MKAIYFTKTNERGPSSRYRVYQFLPYLKQAEVECVVYPLFGETYWRLRAVRSRIGRVLAMIIYVAGRFLCRVQQLLTMKKADLVLIEGQLFPYLPAIVEQVLAKLGHRLIIEFDDAIYLTRFHGRKIPKLLAISTAAIVGNRTLARYAQQFTSSVRVVPTVVDTTRFSPHEKGAAPLERSDANPLRIVWMGLDYNLPHLTWLIPVFKRLQAEQHVRIRVVCGTAPRLDGVEVEWFHWDYETEVDLLRSSDIGIMPLQDTEWTKGKCGLKLIQYMSVGLPAIASPIGVNRKILRDGVNGFLASTEAEWYSALTTLCRDADVRERVGREARRTVIDEYSLEMWAPRLVACYRELSAHPSSLVMPPA